MQFIQINEPDPDDEFVLRFETYTVPQLLEAFNREVGCTGWVSARGRCLVALYQALKRQPIDISVIDTGQGLCLDHRVLLDKSGRRLVLEAETMRRW